MTYTNINWESTGEVIRAIKESISNNFIVLDNFHDLKQEVQKEFVTALRGFLFHRYPSNIRKRMERVYKNKCKCSGFRKSSRNCSI